MPYPRHLQEFDKERNTPAFYKTQGFKKLWNYFTVITESDDFQKSIKELRNVYHVPPEGFSTPKEGSWTHPPVEWEYAKDKVRLVNIRHALNAMSLGYNLLPRDWSDLFESYFFYNRILIHPRPHARNLCFVSDGVTGTDMLGHKLDKDDRQVYPLTVHISPYASKRDILNFIEKVYLPEMARLQAQYKKDGVNITGHRARKKGVRERDDFIVKNRTHSNKKIAEETAKKFPNAPLRAGSIGNTIKREQKRRKKV